MIKFFCRLVVIVLLVQASVRAAFVQEVQVAFVAGGSSTYDNAAGTITWSGGATAVVLDDAGGIYNFDQATVTGTLSGMTNNVTSATFSNLSAFTLALSDSLGPWTVNIAAELEVGQLWTEAFAATDFLVGAGNVQLTSSTITIDDGLVVLNDWWGGDQGLLTALTSLPNGTGQTEFSTDYSTDDMTLQLLAIPEPCTIALLGLGAIGLRRHRRRKQG